MQPTLTQVPPRSLRSMTAVLRPSLSRRAHNAGAACPVPMTIASRRSAIGFQSTMTNMTPRAITIRLAEQRDAQAIALMSRDFMEAGLGWKYDAARVLRAIRDRDTLAVVACEGGKTSAARGALTGFAIMELGDERAHLVLLPV